MKPTLEQNKLIYLQIAETIESDILKDILLEEEQVPSTNQFAKMLQINPATAAKGVNVLVDEGFYIKREGSECLLQRSERSRTKKDKILL